MCVCVKVICPCFLSWDAAPLNYQLGKIFLQIEVLKWEIVFFFVILCPGDFGTFMRDAKRPESVNRNYCSLLRATPHKYV